MADKKIRNFTTAALAGAYIFPFVKDAVTGDFKCTLTDIVTFVSTNLANITLPTGGALRTGTTNANTALLQAYNTGGASYTTFGTLTAGATPTFDLSASTTIATNKLVGSSTSTSVDNRIARYDGIGGNVIQQSGITISDTDGITGVTDLAFTGTTTGGLRVKNLTTAQITALTPAVGQVVYDSTLGKFLAYGTAGWFELDGGVINVKSFGAKGDGTTDDVVAIQAAITALRALVSTAVIPQGFAPTLYFPSAVYRVTNTIDLTAIRTMNWLIEGNGATIFGDFSSGKPVIDMLDARWWTMRNFNIWGSQTNVPTYGIQIGRTRASSSDAGDASFDNVHIHGYYSVACLYNFASETMNYLHLRLYNRSVTAGSYCLILDSSNIQNITSAFVTQNIAVGTQQSFNEQLFLSADIRKENGGTPILLEGTGHARHNFINSYAVSVDSVLVEVYKATTITDLWLDLHAEAVGLTKYLLIDNVNPASTVSLPGLKIKDQTPFCSTCMIDTTGTTRTVTFDNCDLDFGDPQNTVPVFGSTSGSADKLLVSGVIKWPSSKTIDISNARFNGKIETKDANTVTHAFGSYDIQRRPGAAAQRVKQIKGVLQVAGAGEGVDLTNYIEMEGGATGTAPRLTAKGDAAIGLTLIGGSGVASPLRLRATSGVGTTNSDVTIEVGNNGGTKALRATDAGNVGIGMNDFVTPATPLHTGRNSSSTSPSFTIEQGSTGDSSMQFLLSGVRAWLNGIDNSDSDKLKWESAANGFSSRKMELDVNGNLAVAGSIIVDNQAVVAAGALTLARTSHTLANATGSTYAVTLAAPTATELGIIKTVSIIDATNTVTLVTTNISGSGGTTITFDTNGDSITLVAIQTGSSTYKWNLINANGVTIT